MDELDAWLKLARTRGIHVGHLQPLLDRFGSVTEIASASLTSLTASGLAPSLAKRLVAVTDTAIAPDRRWLDKGHAFIPWGSAQYPVLLSQIPDAPIGLFVRGDPTHLAAAQIAVVGARNPTPAGYATADAFTQEFVRAGFAVTSGLAVGIDSASHRGALKAGGVTIAVCATGLDIAYPQSNESLASEIAASGALISEFSPGTLPHKEFFPLRNRIISGISLGTLVVEAATRSGSLITARLAAEQGREVFAIPGSIRNPVARGCHQLLRQGAKLVESVDDVFSELGPLGFAHAASRVEGFDMPSVSTSLLDKPNKMLLDALGFEPASVDLLIERTGLGANEVASMLLILEVEGHIESFPGGLYMRSQPEAAK